MSSKSHNLPCLSGLQESTCVYTSGCAAPSSKAHTCCWLLDFQVILSKTIVRSSNRLRSQATKQKASRHMDEDERWRDLDMLLLRPGNITGPGFEPGPECRECLRDQVHECCK